MSSQELISAKCLSESPEPTGRRHYQKPNMRSRWAFSSNASHDGSAGGSPWRWSPPGPLGLQQLRFRKSATVPHFRPLPATSIQRASLVVRIGGHSGGDCLLSRRYFVEDQIDDPPLAFRLREREVVVARDRFRPQNQLPPYHSPGEVLFEADIDRFRRFGCPVVAAERGSLSGQERW